jgi:1-acyl-sn-glycerol-3-phosphate acyltransferase
VSRRAHNAVRLTRVLSAVFFRSVEVEGAERVPASGPLLYVANHGNSLVDPMLLLAHLPRRAHFLAKHTLWDNPAVRPLLELAQAIPVYRRQDGAEGGDNDETFRRCYEVLAEGGVIALFPEGISYHAPALQPLKTGAARIGLGAERLHGPLGLRIVPVGLTFEDKATFRSRVLVVVGQPIDPAPELELARSDEREAARALTQRIQAGLRAVTLNFESFDQSRVVERFADVYAEGGRAMPGRAELGARFPLRQAFGEAYVAARERDPERVARVESLVRDYDALLEKRGLRDDQVSARYSKRMSVYYVGSRAVPLALALPLAAVGTLLNYIPYRVPGWAASFARGEQDLPATYKLLAGLALAPLCWIAEAVLAYRLAGGWGAAVLLLLAPLSGWIALRFHEQNESFWDEVSAWLLLQLFPRRTAEMRALRAEIRRELDALIVSPPTLPARREMPG